MNQISIIASAMPPTPLLFTASMRAFHRSAEPMRGAVLHNTSLSMRCGACTPSHIPAMPPIDRPQEVCAIDFDLVEQRQ